MIHTPEISSIIIRKLKINSQVVYSYPDPNDPLKKYIKSETLYKKNGLIAEYKKYSQGKIIVWNKYTYDKSKKLIAKEELSTAIWANSIKNARWSKTQYSYDESGNLIIPSYDPIITKDELGRTVETVYYGNGNLNSITVKDEDKRMSMKIFKSNFLHNEIEYSKSGKILQNTTYEYNSFAINKRLINTFDNEDNLVREIEQDEKGEIVFDRIYLYDKKNNLIESKELYRRYFSKLSEEEEKLLISGKAKENGYKSLYTYDDHQLLIKHELYMLGKLVMTYKFTYAGGINE
ncbi:MAG: hypothetical protein MUC87_19590 [Bacteroidia bacterium]|jgi:hypothetical protein|nr:hypothetical protein [Bacteroidia bacterium]